MNLSTSCSSATGWQLCSTVAAHKHKQAKPATNWYIKQTVKFLELHEISYISWQCHPTVDAHTSRQQQLPHASTVNSSRHESAVPQPSIPLPLIMIQTNWSQKMYCICIYMEKWSVSSPLISLQLDWYRRLLPSLQLCLFYSSTFLLFIYIFFAHFQLHTHNFYSNNTNAQVL